jgi:hypothetical protein
VVSTRLGRDAYGGIGTTASRRATLPSAALAEIRDLAAATGQMLLDPDSSARQHVAYAPDVLPEPGPLKRITAVAAASRGAHAFDRAYFESLFASGADPWRYASEYEQGKHE